MRRLVPSLLLLGLLVAAPARAQSACETRCHREGSECLKVCTGQPKEAQKPEHGKRLVACVNSCKEKTLTCKQTCAPPPAPRP